MSIAPRSVAAPALVAGHRSAPDRRRRAHLRELCDEVLASFRVARGRDMLSDGDRQTARTLLAQLTPSLQR
ncbi:hypothetical protein tb265_22200 [Gemmatimonadetes bacterium T265]|nr:hypothetical protein tb265_22200 [Gemmatimonadetes bacterium T265]